MSKKDNHISKPALDSLHKIWKFRKLEPVHGSNGGMGSIENYDLWDLTKKAILSYTTKDPAGVTHSVRYKIVNSAIVLQFPNNENNVDVQFKISELTSNRLKVILHVTYMKEVIKDEDLIELVFEAEGK